MEKFYKKSLLLFSICLVTLGTIEAQNLLGNPSFETGVLEPWTAGNGSTVTIVEDAQEGMWAAQGNIEQLIEVEAGITYIYTAQVKCLASCGTDPMWIGIKDVTGDAFVANYGFTDVTDYAEASITFEALTTGTHRFWVFGQNDADYVSDNFTLVVEGTSNVMNELLRNANIFSNDSGINIKLDEAVKSGMVHIYDLTGKEIFATPIKDEILVGTENFQASGVYVVTLVIDGNLLSKQVSVSLR